jgi:hypothetical protein
MEQFEKAIQDFAKSFEALHFGLNEKLKDIQHEHPNLCAEVTNDFTRIFQLAKDGDLTALNELQNKYKDANNFNK